MARRNVSPSGARRLGDDYQDAAALDILVEWLENEDRYQWVKLEADSLGSLDDIAALTTDNRLILKQIKHSTHPNVESDAWTWENLLSRSGASRNAGTRSLVQKWVKSLSDKTAQTSVVIPGVYTNRRAAPDLRASFAVSSTLHVDVSRISDTVVQQSVVKQLGGPAKANQFFKDFEFHLGQPNLNELLAGTRRRFERLGGTESGWQSLCRSVREWTYYRSEPAPTGEITLAHLKIAVQFDLPGGALSAIPTTSRLMLDIPLVGRQEDIDWLKDIKADCLVAAQPGSGKTALFRALASEGNRYFLVENDRSAILTAIRQKRPASIFVDDAHLDTSVLSMLRQIREETGYDFTIVASTWPGQEDDVAAALAIAKSKVRTLKLLTRDEMVQVIREAGIAGPNLLVRELVDQAEGRPGLAVTLCELCKEGDVEQVVLGNALARSIQTTFEPLIGQQAIEVLAAFATGGSTGMNMTDVASLLGLPLLGLRRIVAGLAAGGVVLEIGDRLAVSPANLRYALVRDVFFSRAYALDIQPFLRLATDAYQATQTLLGAKEYSGKVPDSLLRPRLIEHKDRTLWRLYAQLGLNECQYVFSHRSEFTLAITEAALHYIPEQFVPILLSASVGDHRRIDSYTEHPMRKLQDWIKSCRSGTGECVQLRRLLLNITRTWLTDGGDTQVGCQALGFTLSPAIEWTSTDPGSGRLFTIHRSVLAEPELREMGSIWRDATSVLRELKTIHWPELLGAIDRWVYPERAGARDDTQGVYHAIRSLAGDMLRDCADIASGHSGVLSEIDQRARYLGVEIDVQIDPAYTVLFPGRDRVDWRHAEAVQHNAARDLASKWSKANPNQIAFEIVRLENEAIGFRNWPRYGPFVCEEIAKAVTSVLQWAQAFRTHDASADLVLPFVEKAVEDRETGWSEFLESALDEPKLRGCAIKIILSLFSPPAQLLEKAWTHVHQHESLIETMALRGEIPVDTLEELLRHENASVRTQVAIGMWNATPRGTIPNQLVHDWEDVILRGFDQPEWLTIILTEDKELADRWLGVQLHRSTDEYLFISREVKQVIVALDEADRLSHLKSVKSLPGAEEVIAALVNTSSRVYRALVQRNDLTDYHLDPLGAYDELIAGSETGPQSKYYHPGVWSEFIIIALDAGYSPEEISEALIPNCWSWTGNESDFWQQWHLHFEELTKHERPDVARIGEIGTSRVSVFIERALARERHYDIYGRN